MQCIKFLLKITNYKLDIILNGLGAIEFEYTRGYYRSAISQLRRYMDGSHPVILLKILNKITPGVNIIGYKEVLTAGEDNKEKSLLDKIRDKIAEIKEAPVKEECSNLLSDLERKLQITRN